MTRERTIEINLENLEPFLEKAAEISLASGESLWLSEKANPVTHKLFNNVTANHKHIKFDVLSNGTMNISSEMAKTIIEKFTAITFSLDTLDPRLFEKIRGKPLLKKLLSNIKMLSEMKKSAGLGRHDFPHIKISTVVMESTLDGIPEIAKFAVDSGIVVHNLFRLNVILPPEYQEKFQQALTQEKENKKSTSDPVINFTEEILGEICTSETVSPGRLKKMQGETERTYKGTGIMVADQVPILSVKANSGGSKPMPKEDGLVCPEPWIKMQVHENGNVHVCCANSIILGNINKNSFDEIWNGEKAVYLRKSFLRGEMKGCAEHTCPATVNYLSKDHAYRLIEQLEKSFDKNDLRTILLFRTAPIQKSVTVAQTIMQTFPDAKLSVATNPAGKSALEKLIPGAEILIYPDDHFIHKKTVEWFKKQGKQYDLAAAIYNMNSSEPYSNIDSILGDITANTKIKITYDSDIIII